MGERGFTLIELMVALAIMAIGLSTAVSFMPKQAPVEVESTARQIAAAMREARSSAIVSNHPVRFRVDAANGHYGTRTTPFKLELFTTADLRTAQAAGAIRFYPDGGSTGGAVAVNSGGRRYIVLVDWLSGNIQMVRDGATY